MRIGETRIGVDRAEEHVVAAIEDRLRAVAVVIVDVEDRRTHPWIGEPLRRDRDVVQIADSRRTRRRSRDGRAAASARTRRVLRPHDRLGRRQRDIRRRARGAPRALHDRCRRCRTRRCRAATRCRRRAAHRARAPASATGSRAARPCHSACATRSERFAEESHQPRVVHSRDRAPGRSRTARGSGRASAVRLRRAPLSTRVGTSTAGVHPAALEFLGRRVFEMGGRIEGLHPPVVA